MQNAIKLYLPQLGEEDTELIKKEFINNQRYLNKITSNDGKGLVKFSATDTTDKGYYHLTAWPNKINFNRMICEKFGLEFKFVNYISIQKSVDELPPHIDYQRSFGLIYIIEGPADTVFYRPISSENQKKIYKKNELIEIERHRFKLNNWYAFNNSAIHGVENYSGTRISLAFNLSTLGLFADYTDLINNIYKVEQLFQNE